MISQNKYETHGDLETQQSCRRYPCFGCEIVHSFWKICYNFPDWIYTHIILPDYLLPQKTGKPHTHNSWHSPAFSFRCVHEVKDLMKSIGFGYPGGPDRAANLELPVTSYSGGWKMKMQLCSMAALVSTILK